MGVPGNGFINWTSSSNIKLNLQVNNLQIFIELYEEEYS